ncbi:MAG: PRC-barrel domain-containing protein [Candidatus Micrarchaeia archaeon]
MKYVNAKQLEGKKVIVSDGTSLGKLIDIDVDEVTGKILNLFVEPDPDSQLALKLEKEEGMIKVPYSAVDAVGDYIIVNRKNLG